DEITITEHYSATQLVIKLAQGQLTAGQVIKAYLKRAGIAHQLTNCFTEFLKKEALDRAKYLDEEFKRRGGPVGLLHDLPISLKDMVTMRGRRIISGWIKWIDRIAEDDTLIVKILHEAGAIFYVRTTEPQSLMHLECVSPVYGTTLNPFNRNLTSGGSTDGEGALLGLKASPMGKGTDIGGILDMESWLRDSSLVSIPWRSINLNSKNLTVAVMWDDGVVHPHPSVTCALRETVEHLKKYGIRVIDWEPIDYQKGWGI
ncbi:unnamed protein product, partial [Rotaria sordida]